MDLLRNTLDLYLDAAPWLLFGLVTAGVIKAWVPERGIKRWVGGKGLGSTLRAALIGAPLPICCCGVLPAAVGLRRAGASRQATISFMVSTPETGVDSVAVTYALLGPFFAIARPIAAVVSAVCTGLLAGFADEPERVHTDDSICGCCSASQENTVSVAAVPVDPGRFRRMTDGIGYALTDIMDDIAPWLGVGLVVAGVVATYVPQHALAEWGNGPFAMGAMLLIGIPMYTCATASTPLAASFLMAGVSPGAVMVFLLAGPATNVATLAVVRKEMGTRTMALYLLGICTTSVAAGLAINALAGLLAIDVTAEMAAGGEFVPRWLAGAAGAALALVVGVRLFQRGVAPRLAEKTA